MTHEVVEFNEPVLRKNHFFCKTSEKMCHDIFDCTIKNIYKTKNGYRISVLLRDENIEYFSILDSQVVEYITENNSIWFENELSDEDISSLYVNSYCKQNKTIDLDISEKTVIMANDIEMNMLEIVDLLVDRNFVINIVIRYVGLNIYSNYVKNQWVVKNIQINDTDDIFGESKQQIDNFWKNTVDESIEIMDKEIIKITERKNALQKLVKELDKYENKDKSWEIKIGEIKGFVQNIIFQR